MFIPEIRLTGLVNTLHNEKWLLQQVSEGDENSFEQLYRHYYPRLRPFVCKHTGSDAQAEEIIQETFIRIWLNREKLPEVTHFSAWVYKVASREFLTALRKKLTYEEKIGALQYAAGEVASSPFEQMQVREIKALVSEAVERLPDQRRRVFRMSRDQGLKVNEIAEQLSISPQTVKNMLTTSLRQIREHLAAAGHPYLLIYLILNIL
ncbi:RNA polymerase sigma-70 factor [Chitinophaga horti]|uniref:RNA polymerase sigma-70 factor n=1 Tax=Chitinophaga horti TaxID=2920382 RepID=A0ABY6J4U5_9BACT|nr:RNA polymerase sigma-70 factor [Chitinophaga horti]UYQ94525.1 RNA polymerase sigma-70 factor [Chitinophaga horti]